LDTPPLSLKKESLWRFGEFLTLHELLASSLLLSGMLHTGSCPSSLIQAEKFSERPSIVPPEVILCLNVHNRALSPTAMSVSYLAWFIPPFAFSLFIA